MKVPMMNQRLVVLTTLMAIVACSSDKPHPGVISVAAGGTQTSTGTGTDIDSGIIGTGGTAGAQGGNDAGDMGGDSGVPGGASSTETGGSTGGGALGLGGTTALGGATSGTGGRAGTGGSASPGLDPTCSPRAKAGTSTPVSGVTLNATSQFVAVTPDELTLVWTELTTTGVTVAVAERELATDTWSSPQNVTGVPAVDGRVAISHDGLTLAYVDSTKPQTIATLSRADRTSTFAFDAVASGADFAVQNGSSLLGAGDTYAFPLFGPQSTTFYYAIRAADGALTWYVAGRFEPFGLFSEGAPIHFAALPAPSLVLSGIASDQNTLFFVDPNTAETSWTFYDNPSTQFGSLSLLGTLGFVQPNQFCNRLYGSATTGTLETTLLQ